jgi:flagellin
MSSRLNASENLQAAESVIRDADMARKLTELARLNMLTHGSQAMLSLTNESPRNFLRLLE